MRKLIYTILIDLTQFIFKVYINQIIIIIVVQINKSAMKQVHPILTLRDLLYCQNNNQAVSICSNQTCIQPAFICSKSECSCHSHQFCCLTTIKDFIYKIESQRSIKPINIQQSFKAILQLYDNAIDYLSKKRAQFEEYTEQYGLKTQSKHIMKLIRENKTKIINGKMIAQAIKQTQIQIKTLKSSNFFNSYSQQFVAQIKNVENKLLKETKEWQLNMISHIVSQNDQQFIKSFFTNTQTIKFELLYRASENDFSGSKFRQCCQEIPNVLTIIETTQGLKYAGYIQEGWIEKQYESSCQIDCQSCYQYKKDEEASAQGYVFLASITERQYINGDNLSSYYLIRKINDAIEGMQGPLIGYNKSERILEIYENCNTYDTSFIRLQSKVEGQKSLKKNFVVKEYEVFTVNFD